MPRPVKVAPFCTVRLLLEEPAPMKLPTVVPSAVSEEPAPLTRTELLPAEVPPATPMYMLPLETVPPLRIERLLNELPSLVLAPTLRAL